MASVTLASLFRVEEHGLSELGEKLFPWSYCVLRATVDRSNDALVDVS